VSGANVPYQLRTNKFVERQLFLDLLDFVRVWNGPSKYLYASMGGRFLVDFKLINDRFAIERMISIELDETTVKRQLFNRPLGFIDCRCQSSGEFITEFDRLMAEANGFRLIVWLDYAEANKRGTQLQEYQELVSKLAPGDVVKITLNANPQSYRRPDQFKIQADFHKAVIDNLLGQLGDDYAPKEGVVPGDLNPKQFARLLARSIKLAALKGVEGSQGATTLPLGCYRYKDGEHQMLTVTAFLGDDKLTARMNDDEIFQEWPFRSKDWDEVHEVNVPDLSQREREHINSLISTRDEFRLHQDMPFRFDSDENESLRLLKSYLHHYRRYPAFGRVHI
jgi:hypothetical protein